MILIADSGSTKTDWRLIDKNRNVHSMSTIGFNPYFQDTLTIYNELKENLLPSVNEHTDIKEPLSIYFYGAGCSTQSKCDIVKKALLKIFPLAKIEVDHDLLAAARALCGREKGIAAILGTGSNSCYYDGKNIVENVYSLGYVLGDEGSGAYIGKQFIQDYLNKELPLKITQDFYENYQLSHEAILDAIYKKPMPSRFLASFSKFIKKHKDEPYFVSLINKSFEDFFDKHICKYANHRDTAMSCVGSIAYYYSDTLRAIAGSKGVTISNIIESPIQGLTSYHLEL